MQRSPGGGGHGNGLQNGPLPNGSHATLEEWGDSPSAAAAGEQQRRTKTWGQSDFVLSADTVFAFEKRLDESSRHLPQPLEQSAPPPRARNNSVDVLGCFNPEKQGVGMPERGGGRPASNARTPSTPHLLDASRAPSVAHPSYPREPSQGQARAGVSVPNSARGAPPSASSALEWYHHLGVSQEMLAAFDGSRNVERTAPDLESNLPPAAFASDLPPAASDQPPKPRRARLASDLVIPSKSGAAAPKNKQVNEETDNKCAVLSGFNPESLQEPLRYGDSISLIPDHTNGLATFAGADDARPWIEILADNVAVPPNMRDCQWRLQPAPLYVEAKKLAKMIKVRFALFYSWLHLFVCAQMNDLKSTRTDQQLG